jgi:hypothetical protein
MPAPTVAIVSSGFRTGAAITLPRPDLPFMLCVPSYAGVSLQVQFACMSDPTSADFTTLHGPAGSIGPLTVFSGGAGYSPPVVPPTPFMRVLTAAALTVPLSLTILPVRNI